MSDAPPPPPGQPPEPGGAPPPGWAAPPPPPPGGGGYGQPFEQPGQQPQQPYGQAAGQPYQQYGYGYGYGGGYAEYAGFWIRLAAALLDGLIIGVPIGILSALSDGGSSFSVGVGYSPGLNIALNLLSIVATAIYYGTLEGGPSGQTLGKKVCKIRVVDQTTGQPGIGVGRAVGRYFMSMVSGWALGLGYLWMLWDPRKQTWHDKVVKAIVVKA